MLNSLKQTGKNIGHEISRAWKNLPESWRELLSCGGDALTHIDKAQASFKNGVLMVRLPKEGGGDVKSIPVS